jgi:hypothetical protein
VRGIAADPAFAHIERVLVVGFIGEGPDSVGRSRPDMMPLQPTLSSKRLEPIVHGALHVSDRLLVGNQFRVLGDDVCVYRASQSRTRVGAQRRVDAAAHFPERQVESLVARADGSNVLRVDLNVVKPEGSINRRQVFFDRLKLTHVQTDCCNLDFGRTNLAGNLLAASH